MCSDARTAPPTRSSLAAWLCLPLLSILAGCSFAAVSDGQDASDLGASQSALVTVERTQDGAKTEVVARVLRVAERGPLDESALRMAGFPEDLPALGTCVAPLASSPTSPLSPTSVSASRALELVDLGQVAVELADGTRTSLAPRHVPDPAGVLSGVMYNARISDPERARSPEAARVVVRAAGNPQDPEAVTFAALVTVPHDVTDLRLAGQEPRDWAAVVGPAELTWSPSSPGGTESEPIVLVDVRSADGRITNRCAFSDTGKALLPLASDEGSLVVHRIQRERFHVDGPHKTRREDGEIRFDTSRTITFSRSAHASR